jgi:hypothetical protein
VLTAASGGVVARRMYETRPQRAVQLPEKQPLDRYVLH